MPQPPGHNVLLGRRHALCVGIGIYTNLVNRNLRYAVADATTIAELLADPLRGNFTVTLLTEPAQTSKTALEEALDELLNAPDRQIEDLVVIYFSCHGAIYTPDDTFCLLPSNTLQQADGIFKRTTLFSIYDLAKLLSGAKAQNIVVLLDVCHSGGAGVALQHLHLDLSAGPNLFILGATRQDQVARQSSLLEHGLFTHCLLRAFEQAPSKEGWLTISQIHGFVSEEIGLLAKDQAIQIQGWSVTVDPNLSLLRNPNYPELCPLPPIWNIPFRRNPFFTGQDDLLAGLENALRTGQITALTQPQAISGLGGIGKTQLAIEYAYRRRQDYHAVFWSGADSREALISGFVAIAELLNLPEKNEYMIAVNAVKNWLVTHSKWLLILDNADELALVIEFIPTAIQGHLLLTTRAQVMEALAHKIEMRTMRPEAGTLLLLRRAGLVAHDASLKDASSADVAIAEEISQELGGLPLALDQAGAYVESVQCGLSDYQRLYRTYRAKLLKERGGLIPDHPEPVATTWSISFQKIEQSQPAAADLLRLCSFLYPDAIPEEIITEGAQELGYLLPTTMTDPLTFNKAINALLSYSLIHRDPTQHLLSIHRLVQAVLKDAMDEKTYQQWAERTVRAINCVFPSGKLTTWPSCQRCLAQVQACALLIKQCDMQFAEAIQLLTRAGQYQLNRSVFPEAALILQQALAISEKTFGPEHLGTSYILNELGWTSLYSGKLDQAESLGRRALAIREKALGSQHLKVADSLNLLGTTYIHQLYIQGLSESAAYAESSLQRALTIREKKPEVEPNEIVKILHNLAVLKDYSRQPEEAEYLFKRALAIMEEAQGWSEHYETAELLHNFALHYARRSEFGQAEYLFQRALTIRDRTLGPEHPNVALTLRRLAEVYQEQGKYEQAKQAYERTLTIMNGPGGWPFSAETKSNIRQDYIKLIRNMK